MQLNMSQPSWWKEPAAGALAGLIQQSVMHPIDTIRARLDMGGPAVKVSCPAKFYRRTLSTNNVVQPTAGGPSSRKESLGCACFVQIGRLKYELVCQFSVFLLSDFLNSFVRHSLAILFGLMARPHSPAPKR